jgi:hypothetical protein
MIDGANAQRVLADKAYASKANRAALYQRIKYLTHFFGIPRLPVVGFNVLIQMGGDHGSSDQGNT